MKAKPKVLFCYFAFALLVSSAFSQPLNSLEAKYIHNTPYIKAEIKGKPVLLIYDTGGRVFLLDKNLAADISGDKQIVEGDTIEICFGSFSKSATIHDLWDLHEIGVNFHGLIGPAFFNDYLVELDYKAQQINLYDHGHLKNIDYNKYDTLEINEMSLLLTGKFMTQLKIQINDTLELVGRFIIDTGSGRNITVLKHVPLKLPDDFDYIRATMETASLYGGDDSKLFKANKILFNGKEYPGSIIDHGLFITEISSIISDGLIGGGFLRNFKILIDYKNGNIFIKENMHPDGFDQSLVSTGVAFLDRRYDLEGFIVITLFESRECKEKEIQHGDLIIGINDKDVMDMDEDEIQSIKDIHRTEGEVIRYKIKRRRKIFRDKIFETERVVRRFL